LETEIQDLQSFDIGIMPLDDSPFNRGRLGYKMIQYMAVGIPTVAEDIGLNRTVVRDGENGLLVSGVEGWVVSLRRLLEDAPLRQTLGQSARRTAKQEFSLEEKVRIWERVLEEVGGMKVAKKGLTFVGNKG
jgi:glycosyltransferase involved in cell wall biosynthesis